MINLIPPEGATLVRWEYLLRVAVVWFTLLACTAAIVALTLVPTYVLLYARADALSVAYTRLMKDDEEVYRAAQKSIQDANALAGQLSRPAVTVTPSHIFGRISEQLPEDVTLGGFLYTYDGTGPSLQVAGTADTREALVHFRDMLERDPLFVDAVVPVSSLAKDVLVPFTMTLTLATSP